MYFREFQRYGESFSIFSNKFQRFSGWLESLWKKRLMTALYKVDLLLQASTFSYQLLLKLFFLLGLTRTHGRYSLTKNLGVVFAHERSNHFQQSIQQFIQYYQYPDWLHCRESAWYGKQRERDEERLTRQRQMQPPGQGPRKIICRLYLQVGKIIVRERIDR